MLNFYSEIENRNFRDVKKFTLHGRMFVFYGFYVTEQIVTDSDSFMA